MRMEETELFASDSPVHLDDRNPNLALLSMTFTETYSIIPKSWIYAVAVTEISMAIMPHLYKSPLEDILLNFVPRILILFSLMNYPHKGEESEFWALL
jgi:hypothetical protein